VGAFDRWRAAQPDPTLGDPGAARLRAALAEADWRAAAELFAVVGDPDDRAFYYLQAGQVDGVQDWIPDWVAAEPRSIVPVVVAAGRYAVLARQAPAGDGGELARQRLTVAEDLLRLAVDLDDDDPAPWAFLVATAHGLGLGEAEARRRFAEAVIRHRWHERAHLALLAQLGPASGGSVEAVHDLARRTVAGMPAGCRLGALVARAHREHWAHLGRDDAHLRRPDVVADLHAAADRSVRHPGYTRRPGWPRPHNEFAWAFARAGEWRAAHEQFETVGELVTEAPWGTGDEAGTAFAAARREARRRVGRG
jgi:hypothetical protein